MASKGDTRLLDRLVAQAQGKAGPISAADFDFPKQAQTQPQPLRLPTATTSGNTAARMPKTVNLAELPLSQSMLSRKKTLPLAQMLVPQIGWSDETYKLLNRERPKNIGGINTDAELYGTGFIAGVQGGGQGVARGINAMQDTIDRYVAAHDEKPLLGTANKIGWSDDTYRFLGMEKPKNITENPKIFEETKSQKEYQEKMENATGVNKFLGQVAYGAGNMIPSMAVSTINPALGLATMGLQGFGDAYDQAIEEGKSENEALAYGVLTGATNILTQKLLGGINVFGKNIISKTVGKQLNQLVSRLSKNPTVQKAFAQAGNMASEGIEEYIQAVLDPVFRNITFDENNAIDPLSMDKIEQGLLGMATSGVLNAGTSVVRRTMAGIPRRSYTPAQQQKVIQEYQNATDEELVKFAKVVQTFPDRRAASKMEYILPPVAPKLAADIKEATGIDASGFQNSIKGNAVEHILKRHGENGQHDHSMANLADLGRIQYVLEHYDSLVPLQNPDGTPVFSSEYKNADNTPAQMIQLKKRINGTFYLVEAAPDSKAKTLHVVTAYIQPNKKEEAGQVLNMPKNDPQFTSETPLASTSSPFMLPQEALPVKGIEKEGAGQVPDAKAPGSTAKTALTSTPSPFMLPQEALPVKGKVKLQTKIEPPNGTSSDNGTIAGADLIKGDSISPSILAQEGDKVKLQTKKEAEQQPPRSGLQLPGLANTDVGLNSSIRYDEDSVKSLLDISAAKGKIHTPEQQKVIQEYQRSIDQKLVDFSRKIIADNSRQMDNSQYPLGDVGQREAKDIQNLTGVDVTGYQHNITGRTVRHIHKKHGPKGLSDRSMADLNDIGRIRYVIDHYDKIEKAQDNSREYRTTDNKMAPMVIYTKRVDGTYYIAEAVPNTKAKTLQIVSAYKERAGQAPDVANTTPGMTPKSDLVTTPVSSLAQESDPVNSSSAITPAISSDSAQNRIEYANKPAWQAALQRNEGEERAVPKLADIVERIRETYHIPIFTGKVTHRKALGQYRGKGETIRIRTTNDIPTIAHELGHHLDKQKGFSRGPYQKFLIDRLPPEFKANYSQNELAGEGFAEFMRQYLADRETAKENYGEFYEAFRASFAPPELQALDSIADDINRYMTAKIREKMQAATASRLDREKSGGLPNMLRKFYRAFTEGNLSVKEFVDAYEAENGKLSGSKDPYKLITNAAYNDMITKTLIETGFYDANGRKIEGALSLADALQGISEKEWPDFNLYLMLRHAKEWLSPLPDAEGKVGEPKRVFADDTLNDIATVNLQIRELERESPHFREASEKIYTYLRNLMQYWGVESGLISQDKAYRLWQIYPDYVPFFRQIETKGKGKGPKRGYANQSAPIAKAKGSGAAIYNPIENIIYQTDKFVKAAKYNQVMQAIHNMVRQSDDLGWYLEKVPPDMVPHEVQVADVLKTLRNQVGDKDGQLTDLIDEFLDDTITRFTVAAPKNDIVTVMVDGKRHYYKVHDKDLLKVLTQMDGRQLNEIVRAVNVLTRFFTTFVTGRNPFFSFTSNIWRDFPTAYINGSQGNLFAFGAGIANAYKEQITHSEAFKQYEAMGGGGFVSPISQNRNELRRLIREIQKEDKTKAERLANWIFHPIEAIERLSDIAETAPRFNEFTHVLEKTGDLNEAFYAANEVTTNFRRHGNVGRQINAFVPFFNAAVQGIDKYRRVMTGEGGATKAQRAKYASAAFGRMMVSVVLPSLLAMAWNKDYDDEDDKQYPKLSSYMKNNYWNFALGDGKFFSIPKPREYAVFANVMERAIEKEWMDNEEAFRGFGEYLKDTFFPPGIPQGLSFNDFLQALSDLVLIGSLVDLGRNEDFAGRPVVSEGMKRLPAEQQYNDKTSLLAKTIGQATGTSPMVLDFMIKQNAGVFGTLNAAFTANPAERDFTFGTKNKFIRDAVYSTDILNHFYDERDKYAVQYNGDKRNGQKAAKAYAYDKMASFLSEASALSKENPDASREIRKEMRDMTDSFQKRRSLAIDTELQRIYQNTDCDREIFRDYAAKRKISASKKKESYTAILDFQQLASYQKAIDKAIREAYQEIWKRADYPLWGDGQRAEAFIKAKKKAVNEVKWEFVKKYGEKK